MTTCREITACRVCGGGIESVLDLGSQCLAGQFPRSDEPDPPSFPLEVVHCTGGCGLVQLRHTVDPEAMFRDYYYRSGVSLTMRLHLQEIADKAVTILKRRPKTVLDIGGNDGTLVGHLNGLYAADTVVVDPCNFSATPTPWKKVVPAFYPCKEVAGEKFDLIFSIACFYAVNDPVAFARAVHSNLEDDGLWVVEVGYMPKMLERVGYDCIVHEHLSYYGLMALDEVLVRAGFAIAHAETNDMNGGSLRIVARKAPHPRPPHAQGGKNDASFLVPFAKAVHQHRKNLRVYLEARVAEGRTIHLLGASTKANTVLQWCGITPELVALASDRDPRKRGRKTPGTGIHIVSEEESRALRPDIYLSVLGHFRDELLAREREHMARGGKVVFALPEITEVGS